MMLVVLPVITNPPALAGGFVYDLLGSKLTGT